MTLACRTLRAPAVEGVEDGVCILFDVVALPDLARGTWYVNVLSTYPQYRDRGT